MSTHSQHLAAVRAALEASGREVFDPAQIGAVAETERPPDHIIFEVSRMYGGAELNATAGTTMWRITTRAVSDDTENVGTLLDDCRTALEWKQLTVGGALTGPILFETSTGIGPDDGKQSGAIDWTYDHD